MPGWRSAVHEAAWTVTYDVQLWELKEFRGTVILIKKYPATGDLRMAGCLLGEMRF